MPLYIHNTFSGKKELFTPIDPKNVRMYVCGMTVYDHCHIGHARVLVVFDIVYRQLRHLYGDTQVNYVRNITDIDDKIINRANKNSEPYETLTGRYIDLMHQDADELGVLRPDQEPRATTFISEIVEMISVLVKNGSAYQGDNGDVFYSIETFESYGKLSGKKLQDLRVGQRVEIDDNKRDPMDFVLWKAVKPGEPSWASPWGQGRPGWHIECSAMSTHCLGNHFDIHGGGLDLQFPHHENEIAQSEAATGETFVNVWMHNAFVKVDDEKMSKSLGNFFTIREVLAHFNPEVIRFFILTSHYRSPLNYSDSHLNSAKSALSGLYTALRGLEIGANDVQSNTEYVERFNRAMEDDFNTPEALAVLFDLARSINRDRNEGAITQAESMATCLRSLARRLGFLQADPDEFLQLESVSNGESGMLADTIEAQIIARQQAKDSKDFTAADKIRKDLDAAGVVLEDSARGTTWRRK